MKLQLFYPLKPFFQTQNFGENKIPLYKQLGMLGHNGLDQVGKYGQIVRAAHDGLVTYAGIDGKEGYGVVIRTLEPRDLYYDTETKEYISEQEAIKRGYKEP